MVFPNSVVINTMSSFCVPVFSQCVAQCTLHEFAFSRNMLYFLVMVPLNCTCPVFAHRIPGKPLPIHTPSTTHLCFWPRWLGRHFVCNEVSNSLFGRCLLGSSPQHHTLRRCLALKGHMCNPFIKNCANWSGYQNGLKRYVRNCSLTWRNSVKMHLIVMFSFATSNDIVSFTASAWYNQILDPLNNLYLWNLLLSLVLATSDLAM